MRNHLPECLEELARELPLTMSKAEACTVMQISARSFERAVARGDLKPVKTSTQRNAKVLITRGEVIRWMSERVGGAA